MPWTLTGLGRPERSTALYPEESRGARERLRPSEGSGRRAIRRRRRLSLYFSAAVFPSTLVMWGM